VKILLDEMYPGALADGLRAVGIQASTVSELKLAGSSDAEVFAAAVERGYAVLTENVGDFTRIAAEHNAAARHHHGLLIALSSRFSRRPHGLEPLIAAIRAVSGERLDERIVYLDSVRPNSGLAIG
jgi:hypothetical protein